MAPPEKGPLVGKYLNPAERERGRFWSTRNRTVAERRKSWEQQPDEPDGSFDRFVYYRDLGPTRSIDRAWRAWQMTGENAAPRNADRRADGHWTKDSVEHSWRQRAREYDAHKFRTTNSDVLQKFTENLRDLALGVGVALEEIRPQTFKEICYAIRILSKLIPPETVNVLLREPERPLTMNSTCGREPEIGNGQARV